MPYKPGLHVIGEINTLSTHLLIDVHSIRLFLDERIIHYDLHKLADHYHSFGEQSGFTGMVCLTESHISIHTWPEHGYLTLDVYLSNYEQVNDGKARGIFEDCLAYFESSSHSKTELKR